MAYKLKIALGKAIYSGINKQKRSKRSALVVTPHKEKKPRMKTIRKSLSS